MNPAATRFLSCDWGTTAFRLRWVDRGQVVHEIRNAVGCRTLLERSVAAGTSREQLYEGHLRSVLLEGEGESGEQLGGSVEGFAQATPLPLVISGMASSTIGWKELPYSRLPCRLDASSLRVERVAWDQPSWISATYLVSGAASDTEMMRGEESEALGLLSKLSKIEDGSVLLLPGTHSKHLRIADRAIVNIQTFMTGELFDVLIHHSILRASVTEGSPLDPAAFAEGVHFARDRGLAASLFQTRTRQVLRGQDGEQNASFLSGLLIGAECGCLASQNVPCIYIAGASSLRERYARALDLIAPAQAVHIFSAGEIESAVPTAHALILAALAP